jgi:hypothetical protein
MILLGLAGGAIVRSGRGVHYRTTQYRFWEAANSSIFPQASRFTQKAIEVRVFVE